MCDDELAFVDDAIGGGHGDGRVAAASNGAKEGENVDAISDEGFLLRFFDVGTEVGAAAGVSVGVDVGVAFGEAVAAEMRESD